MNLQTSHQTNKLINHFVLDYYMGKYKILDGKIVIGLTERVACASSFWTYLYASLRLSLDENRSKSVDIVI